MVMTFKQENAVKEINLSDPAPEENYIFLPARDFSIPVNTCKSAGKKSS
jgi:hypothetical protein